MASFAFCATVRPRSEGSVKNADNGVKISQEVAKALNEITGEFTNEDLLGEIFGSFCIGK